MVDIFVPDAAATTTLSNLVEDVYRRLADYTIYESQSWTADGSRIVRLTHSDLVVDSFSLSAVDSSGEAVTSTNIPSYTLDEQAGYVTFHMTPTVGWVFDLAFAFRFWNRELIVAFLNSSITAMWPEFYRIVEDDLTLVDGTYEYRVVDAYGNPAEAILDLEMQMPDGDWYRIEPSYWRVLRKEDYACWLSLDFDFSASDTYRVRYTTRPSSMTSDDTTLWDIGLPLRASEPMVYYACWQCIVATLGGRVRNDRAITDDKLPSNLDLVRASQLYQLLFTQSLAKNRMRPWTARGL